MSIQYRSSDFSTVSLKLPSKIPTSQKMDFMKRLWTNHSKSNHSGKDAEAKDMPLNKGLRLSKEVYNTLWRQHTKNINVGNYLIDYNPNSNSDQHGIWSVAVVCRRIETRFGTSSAVGQKMYICLAVNIQRSTNLSSKLQEITSFMGKY